MADVTVDFIHPTDGRIITVSLDSAITGQEAISELLANKFLDPRADGYELVVKGTSEIIRPSQSFAEAGIRDGDHIRIVAITFGAGKVKPDSKEPRDESNGTAVRDRDIGIPGLDKRTVKDFSIEDIRNSPEALIMIVNLYDDLQLRHEKLSNELEKERFRSRDRFVAALILLISQVVLSIGSNLLTANKVIAVPVLIAGGLQALLALYLTFRKPAS